MIGPRFGGLRAVTDRGAVSERLRTFFRAMSPGQRAAVVRALDQAGDAPERLLVLQALAAADLDPADLDAALRRVLAPLEPFTLDEGELPKTPALVLASSLAALRAWLARQPVASEFAAISPDTDSAAAAADTARLDGARLAVAGFIAGALDRAAADRAFRGRLAVELGGERVLADMPDIAVVLRGGDWIEAVEADIAAASGPEAEASLALRHLVTRTVRRSAEQLPFVMILLRARLGGLGPLIRLAVHCAETAAADRLSVHPLGVAVDLALSEADRALARAQAARHEPDAAGLVLAIRDFGAVFRALAREIDLEPRSRWSARIAALRRAMSDAVRGRLGDLAPRVSAVLRVRNPMPSAAEIDRLESDIGVLVAARALADEIALSADTLKGISSIRELIDTGSQALVDRMRESDRAARRPLRARLDAVVRLARPMFGRDYADVLARSAEVAARGEILAGTG